MSETTNTATIAAMRDYCSRTSGAGITCTVVIPDLEAFEDMQANASNCRDFSADWAVDTFTVMCDASPALFAGMAPVAFFRGFFVPAATGGISMVIPNGTEDSAFILKVFGLSEALYENPDVADCYKKVQARYHRIPVLACESPDRREHGHFRLSYRHTLELDRRVLPDERNLFSLYEIAGDDREVFLEQARKHGLHGTTVTERIVINAVSFLLDRYLRENPEFDLKAKTAPRIIIPQSEMYALCYSAHTAEREELLKRQSGQSFVEIREALRSLADNSRFEFQYLARRKKGGKTETFQLKHKGGLFSLETIDLKAESGYANKGFVITPTLLFMMAWQNGLYIHKHPHLYLELQALFPKKIPESVDLLLTFLGQHGFEPVVVRNDYLYPVIGLGGTFKNRQSGKLKSAMRECVDAAKKLGFCLECTPPAPQSFSNPKATWRFVRPPHMVPIGTTYTGKPTRPYLLAAEVNHNDDP